MTQKTTLLFFFLFLIGAQNCMGQVLIKKSNTQIYYAVDAPSVDATVYKVSNKTEDTIYLWLQKKDEDTSFRHYFFSTSHGCCSLSMCCYDHVNHGDTFIPIIGLTFIKRLCPGEFFLIYAAKRDIEEWSVQYESIKNMRKMLSVERLTPFVYKPDYLIIDSNWL